MASAALVAVASIASWIASVSIYVTTIGIGETPPTGSRRRREPGRKTGAGSPLEEN